MIIDLILDRKDGKPYNPTYFYEEVKEYGEVWPEIAKPILEAMESGESGEVRLALCRYIDEQGYNPIIKNYIRRVNWLPVGVAPDANRAKRVCYGRDDLLAVAEAIADGYGNDEIMEELCGVMADAAYNFLKDIRRKEL